MGKQGPCYHCGVTSTPLWRNGPPDKPILCNACGSRWRTKGSLVNYTPLHARSEPDDFEDHRVSRVKTISIKNREAKLLKRKQNYDNVVGGSSSIMLGGGGGSGFGGGLAHDHHNQGFRKGFDEDTSNRSSSGSAISNSDSYMQLGSADASDLTGPAQSSVVWDTMVPSRKRTCVNRLKQSPVEKLTKDLYTILHEQQSYFSGSSEEDLIFESNTPMVSVEIGHGSVLMRHPNSVAREEESEASSLSVDTKNEAYSRLTTLPVYNANRGGNFSSRRIDTSKKPMNQDHMNRDNDEKLQILMNHNSSLCQIDLKDVINFEEFAGQPYTGPKTTMKSPKRPSMKASYEHKELMDDGGPGFSPRSLFALPPDNSSLMLDSLRYADEGSDQDLLLDVPSHTSFPQAELLRPTSSFAAAQASTSSSSIYQNFVGP